MVTALQRRRMTIDEFLAWDDGTRTRYELVRGEPVAMAPPSTVHARIVANVTSAIDRVVANRPPCRALAGAGIVIERDEGTTYIPDVLMMCEPIANTPVAEQPQLVVEVLSPSTANVDKTYKLPDYGTLPSLREIWLVESTNRAVLVWRRVEGEWQAALPYIRSATFESTVLQATIALDRLYDRTGLSDGGQTSPA